MKYVFVNLKRFDIPKSQDGLNAIALPNQWGAYIIENIQDKLARFGNRLECAVFFPEAHLIGAVQSKSAGSRIQIGCQGVFRKDAEKGKNFGAFTTNRTAKSVAALGCEYTIIGHCEERADKAEIMSASGGKDLSAVNLILNEEIKCAQNVGLKVLYCIGEKEEEQGNWQEVIQKQLRDGLDGVNLKNVCIAYEPVWSIGPGKPVPDRQYIQKVAAFSKSIFPDVPVLYGGGLKEDNASMLASIPEVDGGLVGLTRFSGEIGFYPDEFIRIVSRYLGEE